MTYLRWCMQIPVKRCGLTCIVSTWSSKRIALQAALQGVESSIYPNASVWVARYGETCQLGRLLKAHGRSSAPLCTDPKDHADKLAAHFSDVSNVVLPVAPMALDDLESIQACLLLMGSTHLGRIPDRSQSTLEH